MPAVPIKATPGKFAYIWHFRRIGINATKFEKTPIRFKSHVVTFSLPSPSSIPWPYETMELKQRRRRLRKRHLKSEIALLQTLSRLSHLVQFIKYWQFSLELNSKRLYQRSGKEKETVVVLSSRLPQNVKLGIFTSESCSDFNGNVQKSVVHVQSCCFANLNLCFFAVLVEVAVVVA